MKKITSVKSKRNLHKEVVAAEKALKKFKKENNVKVIAATRSIYYHYVTLDVIYYNYDYGIEMGRTIFAYDYLLK